MTSADAASSSGLCLNKVANFMYRDDGLGVNPRQLVPMSCRIST